MPRREVEELGGDPSETSDLYAGFARMDRDVATCDECGAMVPFRADFVARHREWHEQLNGR